ncbi:MAG: RidA family protein [Sphingomonadales bacterium]|jgi:enamine deaminase RidA (YjgF/YER057c/UK114 family)
MRIFQPQHWLRPKGYSNAIEAEGKTIFLAGQIGWNAEQQFEHSDLPGQFEQVMKNIIALLDEAGAKAEHITRMTWYVTDMDAYRQMGKEIGSAYRRHMGKHFPVMSVIGVQELVEKQALLEIEVTAVLPN